MNQEEIKRNLLDADQWVRVLFMAGFAIAAWFVLIGLSGLVVVQTIIALVSGEPNRNLQKAGYLFGCYLHEIIEFLVYNTDDKPFPFSEFPTAEENIEPAEGVIADDDDDNDEDEDEVLDLDAQDPKP
jgi:hypothetical protein